MLNFLKLILIFGIASLGILYFSKKDNSLKTPHLPVEVQGTPKDLKKAESANILIMGNGIAEYITPVLEEIGDKYKDLYRGGLKVYNWSEKNESIHRTLHKWKSLNKKPIITIFIGGEAEFYERKFLVKDTDKIKDNINKVKDPKLATIFSLLPQVAPYILNSVNKFIYDINLPSKTDFPLKDLSGKDSLKYIEFNLKLFKYFLNELVMAVKSSNKKIIFISYPANPKNKYHRVCQAAQTSTIADTLYEINEELKNKNNDQALNLARILSQKALGNAEVFYKRAELEEASGNFQAALRLYELSHLFDCETKEANKVTNKIIQQVSEDYGTPFIDLYSIMISDFGKGPLFFDGKIPQEKYFSKLKKSLQTQISEIINGLEN